MSELRVERWAPWGSVEDLPYGGTQKHDDVLAEEIKAKGIRWNGHWHQDSNHGVPVFSDGTAAMFSIRGWGGFLADIWGPVDGQDFAFVYYAYEADYGPHNPGYPGPRQWDCKNCGRRQLPSCFRTCPTCKQERTDYEEKKK